MKTNMLKILCLLTITVFTVGCDVDQEKVFDDSASDRIKNDKNTTKNLLTSSENGWVINYFPDSNQSYGGYSYVVKFDEDNVFAYSELQDDFSSPVSSLYDVISREGSVLTFNTNNSLLHWFATPTQDLYQAQEGDYEFSMQKIDNNTIKAKGIISGNDMIFKRNIITPQEYLTKVKEITSRINKSSLAIDFGEGYKTASASNRHINFTDGNDKAKSLPYVVTATGIKLYKSELLNNEEVEWFTLDGDEFKSNEGKVKIKLIELPIDMSLTWTTAARPAFSNQEFIDTFNTVKPIHDSLFPSFPLNDIYLLGESEITFLIGSTSGVHGMSFSGVLGNKDLLAIGKLAPGRNWSLLPHLNPLVDLLVNKSPYKVQLINPDTAILTSDGDPNFVFTIVK
nr:hypothetical protein BACY1_11160 [Tenacibaculum mesophilum]